MASLYKRPRSPFWWISCIDTSGKRVQKSTKFRHAVTADTRRARELCREVSASERDGSDASEVWEAWLPQYFEQRYANSPKSYARFTSAWRNIKAFFDSQSIVIPRQLTRQHVRSFIKWRQERHSSFGCYEVTKNTALTEVKFLRMGMREAVMSGFASINPVESLGIPLDPAPRKPRITEAEHMKILNALKSEPDWMLVSYLIAWHQGCRFSETCLDLSDVDLKRAVIRFRTKGHKDSVAEFPLAPQLIPLFERLRGEGRRETFQMPDMPGKSWWRFFRKLKLGHICFHSTRVTFVTRCYEAGVRREDVMRLVGHSTYAAHAVYPRLTADHSTAKAMRALV
jgi:integrase